MWDKLTRLTIGTLALLACHTPALAQDTCPRAEDMAAGIRLTQIDPITSFIYSRDGERVLERVTRVSGERSITVEAVLIHGLFLERRTIWSTGETLNQLPTTPTEGLLNLPNEGLVRIFADVSGTGLEGDRGFVEVEYLGPSEVTVAGCSYETWHLEVRNHWDDGLIVQQRHFSPELQISLRYLSRSDDGSFQDAWIFDAIARE